MRMLKTSRKLDKIKLEINGKPSRNASHPDAQTDRQPENVTLLDPSTGWVEE